MASEIKSHPTKPTKGRPAASLIDPKALMSIKNLEMRARIVVEGFWNGLHRSPYHGFSVEFTEYRQYTRGDDPRHLDWRLFARSDRYYIKKYEDETNLRCFLLVDNSRSMEFGSLPYKKSQYAATLAATLAYFLYLQGDGVGLLTFDENIRDYLPARFRTGHLRSLMLSLEKPPAGKSTSLVHPLKRITEIVNKRGLMVLISDLLAPLENLERNLGTLAACGHEVVVFQILDPMEVNLDIKQPSMLFDIESGRDLYVDPEQIRSEYQKKLESHTQTVREICQKLGVGFHPLTTDRPLELSLSTFLRDRGQRGKKIKQPISKMSA